MWGRSASLSALVNDAKHLADGAEQFHRDRAGSCDHSRRGDFGELQHFSVTNDDLVTGTQTATLLAQALTAGSDCPDQWRGHDQFADSRHQRPKPDREPGQLHHRQGQQHGGHRHAQHTTDQRPHRESERFPAGGGLDAHERGDTAESEPARLLPLGRCWTSSRRGRNW